MNPTETNTSPRRLPTQTTEPAQFTRLSLLILARKHLPLILACCVATFAVSLFWTLGQSKVYRAEALLRLDPDPPRPLGARVELMQGSAANFWNRREFYESEFRIMRSMRVATATVTALGLNADPGFLNIRPRDRATFKPVTIKEAAQTLITRLSVEPVKDSSLVLLRYDDTDARRCQTVLNAVVRVYLSQNLDQTATVSSSALEWLNGQLERLKIDLEKSEIALDDFRQTNNVLSISLEDTHNMISAQLEQLSKERTSLEVKKFELSARNKELASIKATEPTFLPATEFLQSFVLNKLRTDYADSVRELDELAANHDENYPKVIAARAKVKATATAIASEVQNIRGAVRRDLSAAERQLGDLKNEEKRIQAEAHDLQALEIPYNQLDRTRKENEKIYGLVLERTREMDLTKVLNFNNIRVVDDADEPTRPFKPNTPLNLGLGAVLGLGLGMVAAAFREWSDRSLKTPLDVEQALGVTCLGLLPEISQKSRGRNRREQRIPAALSDRDLIVARHPEGGVSEAARVLRTNLMFMSPDRPYRTLLVTSAIPEEGKTTVACSLATVLAQSGLRVLIVDTDLRRPRLHRTFQVSNDVGVTMAVSEQTPIDECIRETMIENLSVLTSGPLPPNPAEILQSAKFEKLSLELQSRYDRVIYDSPPILPVTDAAVLSRLTDGVVVVARGFRTQKTAVRQAVRQLLDVKAHVVGVVLNAVDLSRHDYREYHYYYKRDGYYTSDAARSGTPRLEDVTSKSPPVTPPVN